MLNYTYGYYQQIKEEPLRSVILESFLLHARNLIDFLENNRNRKDDLTCSDFTDTSGNPIQGEQVPLKEKTKDIIGKTVAHLTQMRTDSKTQWHITEIREMLNNAMKDFLKKCADSNLPEEPNHWRLAFQEQFDLKFDADSASLYRQSA